MNKRLIPPLIGTVISTVVLFVLAFDGTGRNRLDPRNLALANRLASCDSYELAKSDVRVGYTVDGNIVFDVWSLDGDSRLIDPLHLLMQFGHTIKDSSIDHLSIASGGKEVYRLEKSDLDELAREYDSGARIWAFSHWPERLRTPSGERAFESWSGGFLGVMEGQMNDLNEGLSTWLGNAATNK